MWLVRSEDLTVNKCSSFSSDDGTHLHHSYLQLETQPASASSFFFFCCCFNLHTAVCPSRLPDLGFPSPSFTLLSERSGGFRWIFISAAHISSTHKHQLGGSCGVWRAEEEARRMSKCREEEGREDANVFPSCHCFALISPENRSTGRVHQSLSHCWNAAFDQQQLLLRLTLACSDSAWVPFTSEYWHRFSCKQLRLLTWIRTASIRTCSATPSRTGTLCWMKVQGVHHS